MALLVPRMYSGFRGVDFRGEECELFRSPDSLNMWKDYKETDSIRTRPGFKLFHSFYDLADSGYRINGIYFHKDAVLVHVGTNLYKVKDGVREKLVPFSESLDAGAMSPTYWLINRRSHGFVYEDKFYIMDGYNYFCYDGEKMSKAEGYVPTTSVGRKPAGGGTVHEDVNLLSDYRINTFVADGESTEYYLDAKNIDSDFQPVVTVNGNDAYIDVDSVDYDTGCVTFLTPPQAPLTGGQDNVTIKFKKKVDGYKNRILGCTLSQLFDNRVFVTGNPNYPNMVWHCSLNDPTYFSDLDYYREGLDDAKITGMVAGNNALWVFREPSDANTTVFYHTPTIDDQYGKIYPSAHSSVSLGCVGAAINFNDDIVFFSQRGMEGISGDITTEQVAAHRSSLVDRKLLAEADYKNMILAEWEGYLLVFIGKKVYLADSRTAFTIENHIEYEWFYWELSTEVTYAKVHDGVLYLGMDRVIYTLSDYDGGVPSYWVTPKDKFQYPHKLKTTSKRGCVVEATTGVPPLWQGDISVYAKTENTDFELIGTYENVKDYFVSRIKMKKFKDLQLEFYSDYRFSLESATMECFVGGYIKR